MLHDAEQFGRIVAAVLAIGITGLILLVLEVRQIPWLDRLDARHWVERSRSDTDLDPPAPEQRGS